MLPEFIVNNPIMSLWLSGLGGMVLHWLKRYTLDQTGLNLKEFFLINTKQVGTSLTILISSIIGLLGTGAITPDYQTLAMFFMAGYNLNSVLTPHESSGKKK